MTNTFKCKYCGDETGPQYVSNEYIHIDNISSSTNVWLDWYDHVSYCELCWRSWDESRHNNKLLSDAYYDMFRCGSYDLVIKLINQTINELLI